MRDARRFNRRPVGCTLRSVRLRRARVGVRGVHCGAFVRLVAFVLLGLTACGRSLPGPPKGMPPSTAFIEIPFPPPPAQIELIPERPHGRSVWVDGSWEWTGMRWRWKDGGWFEPPPRGVVYSTWQTVRPSGTRLLFAHAAWRDRSGKKVPAPRLLASATLSSEGDAGARGEGEANDAAAELVDAGLGRRSTRTDWPTPTCPSTRGRSAR